MSKSGSLEINLVEKTSGDGSCGLYIKKDIKITKISWRTDKLCSDDFIVKIYFDSKTWTNGHLCKDKNFMWRLTDQLKLLQKRKILPQLGWAYLSVNSDNNQGKGFIHCSIS